MAIKKLTQIFLTLFLFTGISYSQTLTVDTLVNNGNPANRINLVFLGDGYTASQQTQYIKDVNTIIEKMFATTPFKEYSSFFNVYAIHVVSTDSGAKHPNTASDCNTANPQVPVSSPNTALSATFDYGSTHRLLYCTNTSAINSILQQNFPLYDKGLIVVNTPYYGGSGGTYSICSTNPSSAEIMIHELGHSFADLGDEYGGAYCGGSERPNVTKETNPDLVKWKDWFTQSIPIPTPNSTNCGSYPSLNIGLYQGANYCNTGWYRPACNCKMNMLGTPFCNVCNQTLVYCINNSISLIDSYQPSGPVTLGNGQVQTFSASFLTPSSNSVLRTWKLDNSVVASNVNSYQVNGSTLTDGTHSLVLTATDSTYRSKVAMPVYTKTWIITKNGSVTVTLSPFNAVCANTPDFTLTGGSPAGGVYSGMGVSDGKFSPVIVGAGTFAITYTYSGVSTTQSVTVKSLPNISTSGNTTICNGSNTTMTASGATAYTWSPNISLNTSTGATVIASPSANLAYSVTGTSNGCTNSQTVFVFVTSLPNITASSNTSICAGGSAVLTASGGSAYTWSPSTGLSASTGSSVTASPASQVTYTVTGTSGNCSKSQTVTVSVTALPTVMVSSNTSVCTGGSTTLTASGASTYSWAPATDLNATNGTSVVSTPTQSITYTVTGTSNGCSKSQTVSVSVTEKPVIVLSGSTSICDGASTALTASGASTYVWMPSTGLSSSTGTSVNAAPSANVTYTVTGDQGGCQNTQTISVTVKPLPNISVSPNTSVCDGSSATLTVGGASTYLWQPFSSLSSSIGSSVTATPSATTTYAVTGTLNGCSKTKSITVSVNPLPLITESYNLPSCSGDANGSINITVTGQSPFTYIWSNGTSEEDNLNLIQGNYAVTVTSSAGCTQTKDFTILSLSCEAITKEAVTGIKSSSATISWGKTPCSYSYKIRQRQVGTIKWKYFTAQMEDSTFSINNLLPGVSYECQIMSYCKSDFSDSSDYSALMSYTTLSNCFAPVSLTAENILSNSAVLKWSGGEATGYRIRVKEAGTLDEWQPYRVRNMKTELIINNLKASTTYIWQIRSTCNNGSENDHSNYSVFQSFTTLQQPPRIEGNNVTVSDPSEDIQLYPNPNNGKFLINTARVNSKKIEITVTDIFGKKIIDNVYDSESNEFKKEFDISELPAGVYFVCVQKGNEIINKKITKQ